MCETVSNSDLQSNSVQTQHGKSHKSEIYATLRNQATGILITLKHSADEY